jgi:hypothetical protein
MKRLKFKLNGQPDWEAKQHATHLSNKLKHSQLGRKGSEEATTKALVLANASEKFKDVIVAKFKWYWEEEGKTSNEKRQTTEEKTDDEAPAIVPPKKKSGGKKK